jgi:hypothetical protein
VLFQFNARALPEEMGMPGAWGARNMLRLLRLPEPCPLLIDEFASMTLALAPSE